MVMKNFLNSSMSVSASGYKGRPKPYWNFWKVVLAGWVIRYPKIVFLPIGFLLAMIYNVVSSR
jgi:hypothetical protein